MANGNNAENQVTIEFFGICAHFQETVAGVPHRVVLPKADKVEIGILQPGPDATVTPYVLPPHYSFVAHGLDDPGQPLLIDAPPGLIYGIVNTGVRLQIINAIDSDLKYDSSFGDHVFRLSEYMPDFRYGSDVVAGGRASCYFDIFRGTVSAKKKSSGGVVHTFVTMNTDGPPMLQITPLDVSSDPSRRKFYDVPVGPNLYVGNSSLFCTDANVDFLWHYLTNENSIPMYLAAGPPGLRSPFHARRFGMPSRRWPRTDCPMISSNKSPPASSRTPPLARTRGIHDRRIRLDFRRGHSRQSATRLPGGPACRCSQPGFLRNAVERM